MRATFDEIDTAARDRVGVVDRRQAAGKPMLLVTQALPQMLLHAHPNLGRLVTPRHWPRIGETSRVGIPWAADNDCFQGLDVEAYWRMLEGLPRRGCLFVTVPDVVGDARATAHQFESWS